MTGAFVAHPAPGRVVLLVLGAFAFVAIALWMVGAFGPPPSFGRHSPEVTRIIGWLGIVFFGLAGLSGIRRLIAGNEEMRIDPQGIRWTRWSDRTIPWREIVDVTVWQHKRQKMIMLHLRDPSRYRGRGIMGVLARGNRALTGGDVALVMTAMDRSFDEAMAAIARFRT